MEAFVLTELIFLHHIFIIKSFLNMQFSTSIFPSFVTGGIEEEDERQHKNK